MFLPMLQATVYDSGLRITIGNPYQSLNCLLGGPEIPFENYNVNNFPNGEQASHVGDHIFFLKQVTKG